MNKWYELKKIRKFVYYIDGYNCFPKWIRGLMIIFTFGSLYFPVYREGIVLINGYGEKKVIWEKFK